MIKNLGWNLEESVDDLEGGKKKVHGLCESIMQVKESKCACPHCLHLSDYNLCPQ